MKTKLISIVLIGVLLIAFALGASGAVSVEGEAAGQAGKDRLVGVFITAEPLDLFDADGYFHDHAEQLLSGAELDETGSAAYQGRLYAVLADSPYKDQTNRTVKEYVFPERAGIRCLCATYSDGGESYTGTVTDEGLSDVHTAINVTDGGESVSMEGTVFLSTASDLTLYMNPVYQAETGEVYAVAGNGTHCGSRTPGASWSTKLSEEHTVTAGKESSTVGTEIKISVDFIDPPEKITVTQFDANNGVTSVLEYAPQEFPDALAPDEAAAYLVVASHARSADGAESVTRELYRADDESFSAFYCREDGVCVEQSCTILQAENDF